jgi:Nucleotidyl transferase AbiEii toxin, Type IV TA system
MMADKPKIISQGKLQRLVTTDANERAVAPSRAMRWVSAAAFFEVLNCAEAEGRLGAYAIKGGFAVELRHNAAARTSEDIDLILADGHQAIAILRKILPAKWDAFDFRIKSEEQREHVARVNVQVRFNRVDWGTLKIDVVDAKIVDVERVANVAIERFGLPQASPVACLSQPHQIAEWIHCTTRPEIDGNRKNRAHNVVDIYLFDTLATTDDEAVRAACVTTFEREGTHAWPPNPAFPGAWAATIAEVIEEIGLEYSPEDVIAYVTAYIERLTQ